jgi:1-deoxy-D-xylulose-5-phosphate reductoisomerase
MNPQSICILGATGSIGASTLDVIERHPDRFRVFALSANSKIAELGDLCLKHKPEVAVVPTDAAARVLEARLQSARLRTQVMVGESALCEVASAPQTDTLVAAIVGAAGLAPSMAAARSGKRLLLANKEALVMAGALMLDAIEASNAQLVPIDSEHSAIFQCLPMGEAGMPSARTVRRLILTASGGPFRQQDPSELADITPEQACAHPNWVMGRKISVDSATMMNKGLEVIEARWLFGVASESIDVVVHPQSVIHSMVEFVDGSVLAQLGTPDMRGPIAYALAFPERVECGAQRLDFARLASLQFEAPDLHRFPCLALAFDALRAGGAAPVVLNAANEIAVAAFLDRKLRFTDIAAVVNQVLERSQFSAPASLDDVFAIDALTRQLAQTSVQARRAP